jgi:hypothetical protein
MLFIALLGGSLAIFGVSAVAKYPTSVVIDSFVGDLIGYILQTGLLAACLAALWFAPSGLLRAGLLLQVGIGTVGILSLFLSLQIITIAYSVVPFISLDLLREAGDLLSLICLSYGLARWQRSDVIALPLQLLLTLGLGIVLISRIDPHTQGYPLLVINQFCVVAALVILLARPACWKAAPAITLCFTLSRLLFVVYYVLEFNLFPKLTLVQVNQIGDSLTVSAWLIFLLGVVLLAQTQRLRTPPSNSLPFPPSYPIRGTAAGEPPSAT